MKVLVTQPCQTLQCHGLSPSGSSVHGILQQEYWSGYPFPSSRPRDWTQFSCIAGRFFTAWATREALLTIQEVICSETSYGAWGVLPTLTSASLTLGDYARLHPHSPRGETLFPLISTPAPLPPSPPPSPALPISLSGPESSSLLSVPLNTANC